MTKREWIQQIAEDGDLELLLMEPPEFDEAIVGVCDRFTSTFVVYDRAKVIEVIAREYLEDPDTFGISGADEAEELAEDHFAYNVIGGWVGDATPAFITLPPAEPEDPFDLDGAQRWIDANGLRAG